MDLFGRRRPETCRQGMEKEMPMLLTLAVLAFLALLAAGVVAVIALGREKKE